MNPLKRVRYFAGQVLTAKDFSDEQSYYREKQRLRNLLILGSGVVSGLKVLARSEEDGIQVTPGIAIDRAGNEIIVPEGQILPFPIGVRSTLLTIRCTERPTDFVPVPGAEDNKVEATRIEEGFGLEYVTDENGCKNNSVRIAKLCFRRGAWLVEKPHHHPLVTIGVVILLIGLLSRLSRSRSS
jgi:hypothetical protein